MKIAYWDTEQNGRRPPLLGEIKGTPTIRFYKPKKHQGNSHREKVVLDYQNERKAVDMKKFVEYQMPDYSDKIKKGLKDLETFHEKGKRNNNIPRAILFTSKSNTSPVTKYLSTQFRRRLLVGEVKVVESKKDDGKISPNQEILDHYGITKLPALVVVVTTDAESSEDKVTIYDGDSFSRQKLERFLNDYAWKEPYFPPPSKEKTKEGKKDEEGGDTAAKDDSKKKKKQKVHTEF